MKRVGTVHAAQAHRWLCRRRGLWCRAERWTEERPLRLQEAAPTPPAGDAGVGADGRRKRAGLPGGRWSAEEPGGPGQRG